MSKMISTEYTPKKVISILQSGYLPYPGFFELMARCDVFVVYDDVQYDKNSWRNRNRIRGLNGPIWLSVPVLVKGKMGQSIQVMRINNQQNWRKKHLRSLYQYYMKAKYFEEVIPFFGTLYEEPWERLVDLNWAIMLHFRKLFGITADIVKSSTLKTKGHKTERILAICKELEADAYISTNGAKSYLKEELFAKEKISFAYQNYTPPEYPQGYKDFIGYLSTVDLLFHSGPRSLEVILSRSNCPFNEKGKYRGCQPSEKEKKYLVQS